MVETSGGFNYEIL